MDIDTQAYGTEKSEFFIFTEKRRTVPSHRTVEQPGFIIGIIQRRIIPRNAAMPIIDFRFVRLKSCKTRFIHIPQLKSSPFYLHFFRFSFQYVSSEYRIEKMFSHMPVKKQLCIECPFQLIVILSF